MTVTQKNELAAPAPRGQRGRIALLSAAGISITGDGALIAAAPLMAAQLSRDAVQVGLVAASFFAAVGIFGLPAGALVDRWNLKWTMIVSDLARAIVLVLFAALVLTGAATIPALVLTMFLVGIGACFYDPAVQAAIPEVVGRNEAELNRINSRLWAIDTFGRSLAGPPLGAAAFAWRASAPFVGDALSFLASAIFLTRLPDSHKQAESNKTSLWRAVRQGVVYVATHTKLRALAIGQMSYNLPFNVSFAMLVLFAQDHFGLGSVGFGLLLATGAVGGVAAGWLAPHLANKVSTYGAYAIALAIQGAVWLTVATTNVWTAAAALAILGATSTVITVVGSTARQMITPPDYLGRVVAVTRLLGFGSAAVGGILGGFVAHWIGLEGPFFVATILLLLGSLGFTGLVIKARRD